VFDACGGTVVASLDNLGRGLGMKSTPVPPCAKTPFDHDINTPLEAVRTHVKVGPMA
jgi:hypothetical protein